MVVRSADDEGLIAFEIGDSSELHPHMGIMNMLGLAPQTWLAPLELTASDLGVCAPIIGADEFDGCTGTRLSLDLDHPDQPARLIDSTRGQAGGGLLVSVSALTDWDGPGGCAFYSERFITGIRQDCAPDCGPVDFMDACTPEQSDLDYTYLGFFNSPVDPGYDIVCEVLDQSFANEWRFDLDCVGLP
jgi:hypothetical protein